MERLFYQISENEKEKLFRFLETNILTFPKNTIMLSNTKDKIIGIILKGYVQIVRTDYQGNRTIIEELEEGEIFGTILSSLDSDECEAITKENTKVLIIDYNSILSYQNTKYKYYNQFIKNLLEITTSKIEEKNERIEILTKKTIRDKLLEYFNIYAKKHGSKIIYLPFSYTNLADYIAVDRSAMSRELSYLKEEGFIETKGRKITLLYKWFFYKKM